MRIFTRFAAAPVVALLVTAQTALADVSGEGWAGTHMGYGHMGYGGWIFGLITLVLFIGLVVGAIVVFGRLLDQGRPAGGSRNARALLDERFAKGEIDRAEYEERRAALES